MLSDGIPWQFALGRWLASILIFFTAMLFSLVSGFLNWYPIFTSMFIIIGFYIIVITIPLALSLSRSFYWILLLLLLVHISVTISSFALHYYNSGLLSNNGRFNPTYYESLYFSITTFTTLGYGDLQPLPNCRLTTSVEALFGIVSIAIGASLIWLWCQENIIPKEMAFFDGNRRHRKQLGITRIRIRTITGRNRKLKNWRLPPVRGEIYQYDSRRKEWMLVPNNDTNTGNNSADKIGPTDNNHGYMGD